MKTLVSEIQRFSVHDGPGIRTTVFLKGCPLHCAWCHNPECISFEREELYYPDKCIGCGRCSEGCYSGARVICGREMSVMEVMEEVLRDRSYYGEKGGVTISGGEPLAHPEFTLELIKECKKEGINVGMETTLYKFDEKILSEVDILMTDIKILDSDKHLKYTGMRNEKIIENLRRADEMNIPIIVRTPVITGVNDSVENIKGTAELLREFKNVIKYELLPYHPLGLSKARALGIEMQEFQTPAKEKMEELRVYANLSRPT